MCAFDYVVDKGSESLLREVCAIGLSLSPHVESAGASTETHSASIRPVQVQKKHA